MADLLQQGSDWLADQMKTHAGRVVTYRRGTDTVDVLATIGKTEFEVDDEFGVLRRFESRDFLILAADLVLNSVTVLPERGDEIDETQGTVTFTYEVMAPGKEPHFRYSDPYRKTLRIHTKQTETVSS